LDADHPENGVLIPCRFTAEAWRRGVEGLSEPLVSAGKLVRDEDGHPMTIQRYSDVLLTLLLRAHRPEKFRERTSVEIDVSDRLADRLEAARQRAIAKPEEAPLLELKAISVPTSATSCERWRCPRRRSRGH
jgi:hypothetical protein